MAVSLGALAIVLMLFAYAAFVTARRLMRADGRLRLFEALRGQGFALPQPETEAAGRALGLATRRCMTCVGQERCDKLLDAHDWAGLREICPNSAYIDSLRDDRVPRQLT